MTIELERADPGPARSRPISVVPAGAWRYEVGRGTWWWSDEVYTVLGFNRGEVVPTSELLLFHTHPDDRDQAAALLSSVVTSGGTYTHRHRVVDARQRVRSVLMIAESVLDTAGDVTRISGYLVDLTIADQLVVTSRLDAAVEAAMDSRPVIEQAKGVLIAANGCSDQQAFELLKWHSQHHNIKLRDLAEGLLTALRGVPRRFSVSDLGIDELLTAVAQNQRTPGCR